MKMNFTKSMVLLGVVAVAVSGCATYPIAKNIRKQARPVTLSQALENPDTTQGKVVIWGGKIIKTVNNTNGSDIYVLKLPLARNEKPLAGANSAGRFIASSRGFLDPEIYKSGRFITVAGTIAEARTEPFQNIQYTYPVLDLKQSFVWPVEPTYYYYSYPPSYYYPGWYYPGYYWGAYPPWGVGFNWYFGGGDWDEGHWHHHHH